MFLLSGLGDIGLHKIEEYWCPFFMCRWRRRYGLRCWLGRDWQKIEVYSGSSAAGPGDLSLGSCGCMSMTTTTREHSLSQWNGVSNFAYCSRRSFWIAHP